MYRLSEMTMESVARLVQDNDRVVGLLPVGSVEPHGPHLPLGTDTMISEGAIEHAVSLLEKEGIVSLVAPSIPYGVTECASGFCGAISMSSQTLTSFVREVVGALLNTGVMHVCVVNNHLEPAHDQSLQSAIAAYPANAASVACPLRKRWARMLTEEFQSGACHAGRYETSIVLATNPGFVTEVYSQLPEVPVSLSDKLSEGITSFREMGLDQAYAGAPAEATKEEGSKTLDILALMIVSHVRESLGC